MPTTIEQPADWEQPITKKGFSRNQAGLRYDVRLSVAGKQLHVGCVYTQCEAAQLYDLAIWKMAPKLGRKIKPNDSDDFGFITQERVDTLCPRLNKLYDELPFVELADEQTDEQTLRERRLSGKNLDKVPQRGLVQYNDALMFFKRLRVILADQQNKLSARRETLPYLHKLAEAPTLFSQVLTALADAEGKLIQLEDSMEKQRAYYQKLAGDVDNTWA